MNNEIVKKEEKRLNYKVLIFVAILLSFLYFIFRFPDLKIQDNVLLEVNVDPKDQVEAIINVDESKYDRFTIEGVNTDSINSVALYRVPINKLSRNIQKEIIIFNERKGQGSRLSDSQLKEISERFEKDELTDSEKDIINEGRVRALPFIKGNNGGFISSKEDFYSDIVDDRDAFVGYMEVPKTYLEHNNPEDGNVQFKMDLNENDESYYVTIEDYERESWGVVEIRKGIRNVSQSFNYIVYNPNKLEVEFKETKSYQKGDKLDYQKLLEDNIKTLDENNIYYIVSDDVKELEKGEVGTYDLKFVIVSKDGRFKVVEREIKIKEPEKPDKKLEELEKKVKKKAEEIKKDTESKERPDLVEKILEYLEMELRHSKEMLEWMYRSLIEFYPDSKKD